MIMSEAQTKSDARMVKLTSQDGDAFDVSFDVARLSVVVKGILDEDTEEDEDREIPLPNVKSAVLARVIEFAKRHVAEPMSEIEKV